jgi:hypothetical protein
LRDCERGAKQQPAAEPHRLGVIAKARGCEGRKGTRGQTKRCRDEASGAQEGLILLS